MQIHYGNNTRIVSSTAGGSSLSISLSLFCHIGLIETGEKCMSLLKPKTCLLSPFRQGSGGAKARHCFSVYVLTQFLDDSHEIYSRVSFTMSFLGLYLDIRTVTFHHLVILIQIQLPTMQINTYVFTDEGSSVVYPAHLFYRHHLLSICSAVSAAC